MMPPVLAPAHRRFVQFAWITIAYTLFVILFGAWVRITGSGAGCGQHWPTCHGELVPREPSIQTMIEFGHRLTSGVDGLLVLALPVIAWRLFPRGHVTRRYAMWSLVLLVIEALLGAGLVVFELVEQDVSVARILVMPVHLTNTLLLLTAMVLTAHTAAGGHAPRWGSRNGRLALVGLAATMVVCQLGAVTALGDTVFPVIDASLGARWGEVGAESAHLLERVRLVHPVVAVGVGMFLFYLPGLLRRGGAGDFSGWDVWVTVGVGLQLIAGLVNVMLSAPGWMQLVHLGIADLVWVGLVMVAARV